MRAVWMPSERTLFEVDVEAVTRAIPSAKRVTFRFPEATAESRYGPELVSEMSVDFGKGRVLTVPGYMLWKFRDMIPAQLGDEQSGWADSNDFTPSEHGSALMERVRMAHDACCREGNRDEFLKLARRVLVQVTVNLASGKVEHKDRPSVSPKVQGELFMRLRSEVADRRSMHWQAIGELVHEEMSKPLLTLGFKRMPGGMLGREVQYGEWPDPKEMAPQEFLMSLSQRTHANSPAQMQQYDLIKESLAARAKKLAPELLKKLHAEDAAFFHDLAADLKCKPGSGPARVASALAGSNAAFLAYDALDVEFNRTIKRMKAVSELVQMRHARTWSQHLNDEDVDGDGEGSEGEEASRPRSRRVFRLVTRLWLFQREPKQGEELPYVCHSGLDFERLRAELESTFRYGPPVRIRVANDTIDRVTLHFRGTAQLRCDDFGALLLARSKRSRESVIGVRSAWAPLHYMKDRDYCPPPSVIMFVAEADNFADAMFWLDQSKGVVGQGMAMDFLYDKGKKREMGTLPSRLQGVLEQLFNTSYDGGCLLERSAMDKAPAWIQEEQD